MTKGTKVMITTKGADHQLHCELVKYYNIK